MLFAWDLTIYGNKSLQWTNINVVICSVHSTCRYNVFEINDPYVTYKIEVLVQQLDYERYNDKGEKENVWVTVGKAEIGPQRIGQNTQNRTSGRSSGPSVHHMY